MTTPSPPALPALSTTHALIALPALTSIPPPAFVTSHSPRPTKPPATARVSLRDRPRTCPEPAEGAGPESFGGPVQPHSHQHPTHLLRACLILRTGRFVTGLLRATPSQSSAPVRGEPVRSPSENRVEPPSPQQPSTPGSPPPQPCLHCRHLPSPAPVYCLTPAAKHPPPSQVTPNQPLATHPQKVYTIRVSLAAPPQCPPPSLTSTVSSSFSNSSRCASSLSPSVHPPHSPGFPRRPAKKPAQAVSRQPDPL